MNNLWVVMGDNLPTLFFRGNTKEEIREKFFQGIKEPSKYDPVVIQKLTWEKFLELAPDEFQLNEDTSF